MSLSLLMFAAFLHFHITISIGAFQQQRIEKEEEENKMCVGKYFIVHWPSHRQYCDILRSRTFL